MAMNRRTVIYIIIMSVLFLSACGGVSAERESAPEPTIELTPKPTPKPTPEPEPEPIPDFNFPFNFTSEDLQGNIVTEEVLGEKDLFFAYLWAVW